MIFSAAAWLKWQFLCHAGPTEVAGFGLSSPHNPLYLVDVLVIRQRATLATVGFDDHAVADLFDRMTDGGIPPHRFARIWLHTHPGSSVTPSGTDEDTFSQCFGGCDWAVMAILGRTGRTYARLRFNAGPGTAITIPTRVDWAGWPDLVGDRVLSDFLAEWQQEYESLVKLDEFRHGGEWFGSTAADSSLFKTPSSLTLANSPFSPAPVLKLDPALNVESRGFRDFDPYQPAFPGDFCAFD